MSTNVVQNSARSWKTAQTSTRSSEMASYSHYHHAAVTVPVVMAVGKAVTREETPRLGIEAPVAGTQVAHHRLHNLEFAAAELDCLALTEEAHAMFELRKSQVVVAHVANDLELWKSRE